MHYNINTMMWIIESQSGVNPLRNCFLGHGVTEADAWEDAIGPTCSRGEIRRAVRRGWWSREVTSEEFEKLFYGA